MGGGEFVWHSPCIYSFQHYVGDVYLKHIEVGDLRVRNDDVSAFTVGIHSVTLIGECSPGLFI